MSHCHSLASNKNAWNSLLPDARRFCLHMELSVHSLDINSRSQSHALAFTQGLQMGYSNTGAARAALLDRKSDTPMVDAIWMSRL